MEANYLKMERFPARRDPSEPPMLFDRHMLLTLFAEKVHFYNYRPPAEFCMPRSNI